MMKQFNRQRDSKRSAKISPESVLLARARELGRAGHRGWLSPEGEFFESQPTPHGRIRGLELGGHEQAALIWLERDNPELLEQLENERVAGGFETWIETDGLNIIKKFMVRHGFMRVADDGQAD